VAHAAELGVDLRMQNRSEALVFEGPTLVFSLKKRLISATKQMSARVTSRPPELAVGTQRLSIPAA